jgi:hypothetical protein
VPVEAMIQQKMAGRGDVPDNSVPPCVILDLSQVIERKPFRKFMYEPTGLRLLIYYAGDHHIKPRLPCSCLYQKRHAVSFGISGN